MGSHRRRRRGLARHRRAGVLAGAMLLSGLAVLLLAVTRIGADADADAPRPVTAAAPIAAPAAIAGPEAPSDAPSAFTGTWRGAVADPDTAAVDVRLTVGGPARDVVVDVPGLDCTYRGPAPAAPGATTDVRADRPGRTCADTARVRLGTVEDRDGRAAVRYEMVGSCQDGACTPRRASGTLRTTG